MNIRSSLALALILVIFSACTQSTNISQVSSPPSAPTKTQSQINPIPPSQSGNFPQSTPTATLDEEVVVMTYEAPKIILTALNLQLDSNSIKLTEAAYQIATMAAESSALETQLAIISTNAAENSSNQNSNNSGFEIPSNVHTVVTVNRAVIFIANSTNKAGAPIMIPYEPRVVIPPGTEAWVYKKQVKADGGAIYYESYDPDGQSNLKVYFRAKHIQIRLPNGKPDPDKFPANVAKAQITDNTVLFVINSYDKAGKPVMETYKPYIRYTTGKYEIVYPEFVVGTGGTHWYPIYDPDGQPSGYIRSVFISFPETWD